ncbi:MAG: SpoIIE family protein phosphatase [Candidatus Omnitrophica bacterium]|nr:SpoIIE family protein phosphatase [Candidatus Omnitrophota bacterium]
MRLSIKFKIAFILFISTFVLTFLLNISQQYLNYKDLTARIQSDANAAVELAVEEANLWFHRNLTTANLLGLELERRSLMSQDLAADLDQIAKELGAGKTFMGRQDADDAIKKSPWFLKAKKTRAPFFLGPYPDKKAGGHLLIFGAPLFDASRLMVVGAVAFDKPLGELKEAIGRIFINEVESIEIFQGQKEKFVVFVRPKEMPAASFRDFSRRVKDERFLETETVSVRGEKYLAIYSRIEDAPLWIYYPVSLSRLMRPVIERSFWIAAASAAGLLLIFFFTFFLVGRYIRRIQELNRTTQTVASGDFTVRLPKTANDEIGDLALSFNRMTEALVRYMEALKESVASKERMRRELELAAEIQQRALPESIPAIAGAEIAAKSWPAYEVGGDYFDFLPSGNGDLGIVIADAAGKGLSGTLFMTDSRSVFRVMAGQEKSPDTLFTKMNDFIAVNSKRGMFMTAFYSVYNPKTRTLLSVNAGHYAPVIFRAATDEFIPLKTGGLPVGVMPGEQYKAERLQLSPGDVAVFFTDGMVEASNAAKEMYGQKRLEAMVQKNAGLSAAGLLDEIEKDWRDFCRVELLFDDMTLVVLKILPTP